MVQKFIPFAVAALSTLSLIASTPGFDIWIGAYLGFAGIIALYDIDKKRFILWTCLIALVFYLVSMSWLRIPMTDFGNAPFIAGVGLVVFTAIAATICFFLPMALVIKKTGSPFLGAIVLVATEMLKSKYFFGGLPWLNIGSTQYNNPIAVQSVSLVGEQGLSFLVVLIGFGLYYTLIKRDMLARKVLIGLVASVFVYGIFQLYLIPAPKDIKRHTVRMVQTGIPQEDKWDPAKRKEVTATLLERLNLAASNWGVYDIMVLPESSFNVDPFAAYASPVREALDNASNRAPIAFGYERYLETSLRYPKIFNAFGVMHKGELIGEYDKIKLAPFGEYFPFEKQLYPIRKFFFGDGPLFTPGEEDVVIDIYGMRIAPLICFDSIFSELWRKRIENGANLFLIISNDSWFGESIGRWQHLAIDTIHAVEYGRYMVRVTQDGISSMVNNKGETLERLPEKQFSMRDVDVYTHSEKTLFTTLGYSWYIIVICGYAYSLMKKRRALKN